MLTGIIGTAHYAAPELMNGNDEAADGHSGIHVATILKSDVYRCLPLKASPTSCMLSFFYQTRFLQNDKADSAWLRGGQV